ncbi:hypothetical protein PFICI_14146 [Pestalotiopsis fici W106-1]|uniref:2EXR domain-containing protein n=1 Tax=Pestalotiopsis fici (strain W106-1 / CGMCC3.15140) TaxID=1229662 RepID=W3WK47_PESFW|nr:uncharacterized protein PFICI_14146 [Pestalotiopsis fici W106-1]ETS74280.1 hypothetical protein PFICI_14146 [Pestalotiopsis fici W106-1]
MATFMQLPCELRTMIWDDSMPEDIPEVCILPPQEEMTDLGESDHDSEDDETCADDESFLTVDTAFSVLMHLCHEARDHALSRTRLHFSPAAGIAIPFRRFRPELDVLYVPPGRPQAVPPCRLFARVRHVALAYWRPLCTAAPPVRPPSAACVFAGFPRVEAISIVVPSSKELPSQRGRLYAPVPARRCRLEPFYTGAAAKTNIIAAFRDGERKDVSTVLGFLNRIHCDIACYHMSRWRELGPRHDKVGGGGFVDLSLAAQYFAAWSPETSSDSQVRGSFLDSLQFPDGFVQHSKCT